MLDRETRLLSHTLKSCGELQDQCDLEREQDRTLEVASTETVSPSIKALFCSQFFLGGGQHSAWADLAGLALMV